MYRSVGHAIAAMLRLKERRESPRPIVYNRTPGRDAGKDPDADALTVAVLFARFDRRGYLRKNLIDRVPIDEFRGRERMRAARAKRLFIRELCHRGLLMHQGDRKNPQKTCGRYQTGDCPRFPKKNGGV